MRDETSQPTRQAAARPIITSVVGSALVRLLLGMEMAVVAFAATDRPWR
jgi:hypothetical protein